jgi:hypothetical protein
VRDDLPTADDQGMACVISTGIAGDEIGLARQRVDDLALALIAPLQANDGGVAGLEAEALDECFRID